MRKLKLDKEKIFDISLSLIILILLIFTNPKINMKYNYHRVCKNYNDKNYYKVVKIIDKSFLEKEINDYKKTKDLYIDSKYQLAKKSYKLKNYNSAYYDFKELKKYNGNKNYKNIDYYINDFDLYHRHIGYWVDVKNEYQGFVITEDKIITYTKGYSSRLCRVSQQQRNEYTYELINGSIFIYEKSVDIYMTRGKIIEDDILKIDTEQGTFKFKRGKVKIQKKPQIGMTKDEVKNSTWGSPEDINTTTTVNGVSEQWCYFGHKYIYFDDGIVTCIQD